MTEFKSGAPMFVCDPDLRILEWNDAARELTGIDPEDAVGARCWQVLSGRDDRGGLVCHRACSHARLAREGWPVATHALHVKTPAGPKRVEVEIVAAREGSDAVHILHLLRDAPEEPAAEPGPARPHRVLTERQLEVLELLDSGLSARDIASRLGLTLPTARNHIHAILVELGVHSQLQAVAVARKSGLISQKS